MTWLDCSNINCLLSIEIPRTFVAVKATISSSEWIKIGRLKKDNPKGTLMFDTDTESSWVDKLSEIVVR